MFLAVAAGVIGGTSLAGGSGTIIGGLIGAGVLGVLSDGLTLIGVNAFTFNIILGVAILLAMIFNIHIVRLARSGKAPNDATVSHRCGPRTIVKRFGAVTALDGVTVELRRGEILGILGDNGAGKSTLIKIFTGYQRPTSGRLLIDGQETALRSVDHARALGIECVYQDLALANSLSVYLNLFLNREITYPGPIRFVNHRAMRRRARELLDGDRRATSLRSICRWSGCPAGSGRRSRWRARSTPRRASCCWMNRSPRWARAKRG